MKVKNLVLGAGISGLACANRIIKEGGKALVCEARDYFFGGGCHSFWIDGFCFDSAVHLSFTNDKEARAFFDTTPYQTHLPIAYNYYDSLWMKHPIINNMYLLGVDEKVECIKSFIEREEVEAGDYSQWLRASYGNAFAKKFYDVYTRKYWTVNPGELSTSWVGSRLNNADLEKILKGAFTTDTGLDYYAKEMRYPLGKGGYETFLKPLAQAADILFDKQCVKINLDDRYVLFQDGFLCYYDNLFSSIPLPEFVKCLVNVPVRIRELASSLEASKVSLVSIGFRKPDIPKWLWFYIYDEDIMAARVNSPSMKCKENAPAGCSSLQFEVYHNPKERIDRGAILDNTRYALQKMNLCDDADILFMDYRLLQYGNVIFYKGMEDLRDQVKGYLSRYNLKLIGRFGEWDYLWSDQSYLSGWKAPM